LECPLQSSLPKKAKKSAKPAPWAGVSLDTEPCRDNIADRD
jgi:hypothetical protein